MKSNLNLDYPGHKALRAQERDMSTITHDTQPIRNSAVRAIYKGTELRREAVRPGAMYAYTLPSLVNGRLVAPKHGGVA